MERKITVFMSVFHPLVSRNILNSGVLSELIAGGARVVMFVPKTKERFYRDTYGDRVEIEVFNFESYINEKEKFFVNFAELLISTNVMRFRKLKIYEQSKNFLKYFYKRFVTALFGRSKLMKKLFRWLDLNFNNNNAFDIYYEKYNPNVVFSTNIFVVGDVMMLKSAKNRNVKTVGLVASWDNTTTKGLLRVIPDTLLVHNEIIKEEAINIQDIPERKIKTVGIAHFDSYKDYKPISREDFCKKMGIEFNKRIIVFSPAGNIFISTDWQICEILKRSIHLGEIPDDVVILVRVHPTNPTNFDKFNPDKNFVIDEPGVEFEGLGVRKKELDKNSQNHLLDTLFHADLIINVVSSMVIDAAVLDKPIITIGFDGWEKEVPFGSSVTRYHTDENMAKLLDIGGTAVVRNPEELIKQINLYLEHPEFDRDGRARIVEKQCWKLDGKSKIRVAEALLSDYK